MKLTHFCAASYKACWSEQPDHQNYIRIGFSILKNLYFDMSHVHIYKDLKKFFLFILGTLLLIARARLVLYTCLYEPSRHEKHYYIFRHFFLCV